MRYDSHKKSMLKSVVWRILGIIVLATVTYSFTKHWIQTGTITFIHHGIFLIVFYLHERAWAKCGWKIKYYLKAFTYEIVLGNLILGTITYLVTGDVKQMTAVTLTYIGLKLIMYPIYDHLWSRRKVVYAYVVADLLHVGHLIHLERAKRQGNYLIVGVLTTEATMEKKPMPIMSFDDRCALIGALKCVDEVIPQKTYSPLDNVRKLKPSVLMESTSHLEQPANDYVESYGGRIVTSPYFKEQSSTKIKDKIKSTQK